MKARKFTQTGLRVLRERANGLGQEDLRAKWKEFIAEAPGVAIVDLNFEIPVIPFEEMGHNAARDKESAALLFQAMHPSVCGKAGFDLGFWVWLSLAHDGAWNYVSNRWDKSDIDERVLGHTLIRQALVRLWLGAYCVAPDDISANRKEFQQYVNYIFSSQDLFEATVGRTTFRERRMARMFTQLCSSSGRGLQKEILRKFAVKLNHVLGIRFLPGLDQDEMNSEATAILESIQKKSGSGK